MQRLEFVHTSIHGHDMAFRTGGSGPVMLLVHGMAGSSSTWSDVMPALAEHFTVVAPDLPGHGASAKPRGDYSLGALADSLRDLLVMLGHDRATPVGRSLGGGVAMQFAYQFPERCERLVLVSSGGLGEEINPLLRALSLPGAESLLALACTRWAHSAGARVGRSLRRLGLRSSPQFADIWDSYASTKPAAVSTPHCRTRCQPPRYEHGCVSGSIAFPSRQRGFDSRRPLSRGTRRRGATPEGKAAQPHGHDTNTG
jgi:pimeloyl-ACP methyl ester carboxylesterase